MTDKLENYQENNQTAYKGTTGDDKYHYYRYRFQW
jgi:hypothetical protein